MTGGEVVVLGATGRNFAAGMSGGVAYVLDLGPGTGQHRARRSGTADDAAADDRAAPRLRRHAEETGSPVAGPSLADWPPWRPRFTEVMPREYRLVLEAKAAAERDGVERGRHHDRHDGGSPWLTPVGFLTTPS